MHFILKIVALLSKITGTAIILVLTYFQIEAMDNHIDIIDITELNYLFSRTSLFAVGLVAFGNLTNYIGELFALNPNSTSHHKLIHKHD